MEQTTKKDIVSLFLNKGILLSPEKIKKLTKENTKKTLPPLMEKEGEPTPLNKEKPNQTENKQEQKQQNRINILYSFKESPQKKNIQDFINHFNSRYSFLKGILQNRPEVANTLSIRRIKERRTKEDTTLIGMVVDKKRTKLNNLLLIVEDPTGTINVLINQNKKELFSLAENIMLDEVIGIRGTSSENIVFATNIIFPDIPNNELKKAKEEGYAIFLSDIHVGSKYFLSDNFDKFLKWINGGMGNKEQKEIAKKVKYLFIAGDIVDGVGIYPNQEEELELKDITEQYTKIVELLKNIPQKIKLIICPGNHDSVRVAEPQPPPYKEFANPLYELPNATIVSNPSLVNIDSTPTFSGFNVLMYHGYSFDYFIANIDNIRLNGGYNRADLVMKYLLQRRHLAPTYTSTPIIPAKEDPLLIKQIPDIFITGHIHYCVVSNYKNISLISGSCWQDITSFQEKMGHKPEPARVPIINLKTREMKILRF